MPSLVGSEMCIRDRPGPAGPPQAGQRPLARSPRPGHRQHGRDHRDPGTAGELMGAHVLVINSGSVSIKYQLVDADTGESLASGLVERIGQESSHLKHETPGGTFELDEPVEDHEAGMALSLIHI